LKRKKKLGQNTWTAIHDEKRNRWGIKEGGNRTGGTNRPTRKNANWKGKEKGGKRPGKTAVRVGEGVKKVNATGGSRGCPSSEMNRWGGGGGKVYRSRSY